VEATTRSLTARLEFANPGLALKLDMYGDVEIMVPMAQGLAVPEQAVVDTGARKVVFVQRDEQTFIPREVSLGPRAEGYYPVLSGLQEGERVVSSANFLIDSESRFQAAIEAMGKGPPSKGATRPTVPKPSAGMAAGSAGLATGGRAGAGPHAGHGQ